ncbi:MAG: pyridoxal phosphate-dependent aminotransferase [Leptospira sp.]|nr:pyridoxal phosphate-dependent aminotransferase [Leptospira sp.]NCS92632.1 pyridoxal phosphate-dependent aminotransferase [Leptospira sp.]
MSHLQSDRFKNLEENSWSIHEEMNRTSSEIFFEENPIHQRKQILLSEGKKIIEASESNPTKCGIVFPKQIIHSAIEHDWSPIYEAQAGGTAKAKEAVVQYYQDRFPELGASFQAKDFTLVASTSEAYSYILKSISNPGDEILVPQPGYPLLEYLGRWEMLETIPYSSWEAIPDLITEKTKAILIVQPNNPTGSILSPKNRKQILQIASEFKLPIIIDEVFADYVGWAHSTKYEFLTSTENTIFTLNGVSKICLLPGIKLSWIHLQAPVKVRTIIESRLDWLADTYLSVNSFAETILPSIFEARSFVQNQLINRMKRNLGKLQEVIPNGDFYSWNLPEGGWYIVLETDLPIEEEDEFCMQLLEKYKISFQAGSLYNSNERKVKLILSFILEEEIFAEVVYALDAMITH